MMVESLQRFGHQVQHACTGEQALEAVAQVDFVLLDLGLPDLEGQEVCRRIRQSSGVPVIVVTGRGDELDCILLLKSGADDYVVKPCSIRVLLARMDAIVRRCAARQPTTDATHPVNMGSVVDRPRRHGALSVDLRARRAVLHDREIVLTRREFDLLAVLLADPGAVVSRRELIEDVWDANWHGSTRTLDVHIGSLRTKLGDRRWIESVRGVGFRIHPAPDRVVCDATTAP